MILSNLFSRIYSKTLKQEYEATLKYEFHLDEETIIQYDIPAIPATTSITLTEQIAFATLGEKRKQLLPNFLWSGLLNRLIDSIPNKQQLEGVGMFIGQVPDYRYNASILPISPKKYLVLINSGLALFLFRMARIFIATCRFRDLGLGTFEPEITNEEAKALTRKNIQGIVHGDHLLPLQLKQPVMIKTSTYLTEFLELFVIAHELVHLFLELNNTKLDSKVEEFSANGLGYIIYKNLIASYIEEIPEALRLPLFYSAPHFLFYIFSKIEHQYLAENIKIEDTHPAAYARSDYLKRVQIAYNEYDISEIDKHVVHFANIF